MKPEEALDIICDVCNEFNKSKENKMIAKVVLNANILALTQIEVQKIAEMCVQYKEKGVIGFMTTSGEIDEDAMKYYENTFDYLQNNFVPVTIFAGEKVSNSVTVALNQSHARRISGGFKIAQNENLLNDVTSHNNAILVNSSIRMNQAVSDLNKSLSRFFFDFGVKIAFCSIHNTFSDTTRSHQLFNLAQSSGFDALAVLKIIDNTFASINMHYKKANSYQRMFWNESLKILKENGFKNMMDYTFFKE